mgnify:CR=1 FL=1
METVELEKTETLFQEGKVVSITTGDRNHQKELQIKIVTSEFESLPGKFTLVAESVTKSIMIRKVKSLLDLSLFSRKKECSFFDQDTILSWLYYEQKKNYRNSFFALLEKSEGFLIFFSKDKNGNTVVYRIFVNKIQQVFVCKHRPENMPFIFENSSVAFAAATEFSQSKN